MRIIGADPGRGLTPGGPGEATVAVLDGAGDVETVRRAASLPEIAEAVRDAAAGDVFVVGVDLPVVVPGRASRGRRVDAVVRRRFGLRRRAATQTATSGEGGISGESLLAGLAAAGQPCLAFPDRDRRSSGLAEVHVELALRNLLWERSSVAHAPEHERREELYRGFVLPAYRAQLTPRRSGWTERAAALELLLQALGSPNGYDLRPVRDALARSASATDVERAASLLDAVLLAGTVRRYLEAPETCLFLGDREQGYAIMPADGFVRRLAARDVRPARGRLFPRASLRERLGEHAELRSMELLELEGRPPRTEATFREPLLYEFDNVDEMLWWKHCRHLAGPQLPLDGLAELVVRLGSGEDTDDDGAAALHLTRSRHRTLSFRFDPPSRWRAVLPTRDGKTYPIRILRAVYETAPAKKR